MSNKQLCDQVTIVTGASRGIGKAIATGFAKEGAKVVCAARTQAELNGTVAEITDEEGTAIAVRCDATNRQNVANLMEATRNAYDGLDILVLNAGGSLDVTLPVEYADPDQWTAVVELNLYSAFYCAQAAIPLLKKSKAGKIITVGSGMGHRPTGRISAYSVGKAALRMFTQALSLELAEYDIAVNELVPGPVQTRPREVERIEAGIFQEGAFKHEWHKQPEDVVPMALFLATQPRYGPTGQTFAINRRLL